MDGWIPVNSFDEIPVGRQLVTFDGFVDNKIFGIMEIYLTSDGSKGGVAFWRLWYDLPRVIAYHPLPEPYVRGIVHDT